MDPHAHLSYGYDLGRSPRFVGLDEDDWPDWYDDLDFCDAAEERLLVAAGFTEFETDGRPGYYDRRSEALAALGVQIVNHGSDNDPGYILAVKDLETDWDGPVPVENFALPDGWEQVLAQAVATLGLDVADEAPGWLLSAYASA